MITVMREVMRRRQQADGFTLIELVVALTIATVIFSAMAAAGLAGVRASGVARQNQQAVDVLNRVVEQYRAVSLTNLAMVTSDLQVGDSSITTGSTPRYTVPNGVGQEAVWAKATGSVSPHVTTTTSGDIKGIVYTVKAYVTTPPGTTLDSSGQPYQKRLTVVATWISYGQSHQRIISTILTETTRGLPLPRYSVIPTSVTTLTGTPSSTLTWGMQVINRGARDTFNVSASIGTWTYYVDTDCDGARDVGEDTLLTNTDPAINTQLDTGKLEPNNNPPFCMTAQRAIPAGETGASSVTFNFLSSAQPTASGAAIAVGPFTVTVTSGSTGGSACTPTPAGVGTPYGFRNGISATNGNTTTQPVNSMSENTCLDQPASANYSTDIGNGTGRSLTTGGSAAQGTSVSQLAEWRWNPPATRTVAAGTATAVIWVSCPTVGANVTLNGAIGTFDEKSSGTWTSQGTGSAIVSCATANTWTRIQVPMTVGTAFSAPNKVQGSPSNLSVRLWTAGTAGQRIRLDYEQPDHKSFLYANVT